MKLKLSNNRAVVADTEPIAIKDTEKSTTILGKQTLSDDAPEFVVNVPHMIGIASMEDKQTEAQFDAVQNELNARADDTFADDKAIEKSDKDAVGQSRWQGVKVKNNFYVEPLTLDESLFETIIPGVDDEADINRNMVSIDQQAVKRRYIEERLPQFHENSSGIYIYMPGTVRTLDSMQKDIDKELKFLRAKSEKIATETIVGERFAQKRISDANIKDAVTKEVNDEFDAKLADPNISDADRKLYTSTTKRRNTIKSRTDARIKEQEAKVMKDAVQAVIDSYTEAEKEGILDLDAHELELTKQLQQKATEEENSRIFALADELYKKSEPETIKKATGRQNEKPSFFNLNKNGIPKIIPLEYDMSQGGTIPGWYHYQIDGRPISTGTRRANSDFLGHNPWARQYYGPGDIIKTIGEPIGLQFALNMMDYLHFKEDSFVPVSKVSTYADMIAHPFIYHINGDNTMDIYCAYGNAITPFSGKGKDFNHLISAKFKQLKKVRVDKGTIKGDKLSQEYKGECFDVNGLKEAYREDYESNEYDAPLKVMIVFSPESFDKDYSEDERSYIVDGNCLLNKDCDICGDCLDGQDMNVNLSQYIDRPENPWVVEECYLIN